MQIIIIGCGKVGRTLIAQLSKEDNNLTVIDHNAELVRDVSTIYDVMGIVGNGTSYNVLKEADLEHTDMLIAVTQSDEVNLLCCVIAKQKANCHTIARVRNPIYSTERHFLRTELKLSMIINPEQEAAQEIARLLRNPNAIEVDTFAKERIDLLRFRVPNDSMMIGKALRDLTQQINMNVLVCIAERNNMVTIPNGDYVVEQGDILTVISMPDQVDRLFRTIGVKSNRVSSCMVVGGGELTYYLTEYLLRMGIDVKIIENNRKRCEELNEMFPDATIVCGDGSDQEVLNEERIENMDAFVSCTGIDEVNAILSMYAQKKVKKKVVTKLNHVEFNEVIQSLELDSVINPKQLTAQRIIRYVRATRNVVGSNVETLYRLMNDRVEAIEFLISPGSTITGICLKDMKMKNNVLIAGIVRNGRLIIPRGTTTFEENDSVIVVTTHLGFSEIYDILR